ncbi:MAG: hypothetical protein WCD81_11845 [Candidatus Bathyarchaeia archaeon]
MKHQRLRAICHFSIIAAVLLILSIFLTYNVLTLPSLVIGDNVYWTKQTIVDILGPKVIRESYLGDIAVLSTFRTGFLFPLSYLLNALSIPLTLIYPFLLYFLSMLSFYTFSREFLTKKFWCLIVSAMYVINPITPYYFASMLYAFVMVFLPLALKFFIRTLREISQQSNPGRLSRNFLISAMFLSLSVSAHEQFFLSAALISIYLVSTFVVICLRKYGQTRCFVRASVTNVVLFVFVFIIVNAPLILSVNNINFAPLATYFKGNLGNFLSNIQYCYANANPVTLFRLGGDSGVGLGQNSWYDSSAYTNLFGYALFIVFLASILLLFLRKDVAQTDKAFFYMNILVFVNSIILIEFIKYLPNDPILAGKLFSFILQTWESPTELRVILLLSLLTTTFVAFKKLETYGKTRKKRIAKGTAVILLVASVVLYNSPWLISYAGYTPLQQISDNLQWGNLFDTGYSKLANLLSQNYSNDRGVLIPYTHKAELYLPPNFRLFQLVSNVNDQTLELTDGASVPWSKILGLFSAKYVVVSKVFQPNELLIFPESFNNNITSVVDDIENDSGLHFLEQQGNYTIFENQNCLPTLYATRNYVFYDDTSTLKYAFQLIDFQDLPVFLNSEEQINQLSIPSFVNNDTYQMYALRPTYDGSVASLNLTVTFNGENIETLTLNKLATSSNVDVFSTDCQLSADDIVKVPSSNTWADTHQFDDLVLNSTSFPLGTYGSFMLNFTVNVSRWGQYDFQGPRALIDTGNSKYFVIFHNNGFLELAVQQGDSYTSDVITTYVGHDLMGENNPINVTLSRTFDEVKVYVNNNLEMSFPTEPNLSTVSLSSEASISKFSGIHVQTADILGLFAVRQVHEEPVFSVQQDSSEGSAMTVLNGGSDYAVVDQYLYNGLQEMETPAASEEVQANVFFKAWIVNGTSLASKETNILIGTTSSQMTIGLTAVSIGFTYLILIIAITPFRKKISSVLSRRIDKEKRPSG